MAGTPERFVHQLGILDARVGEEVVLLAPATGEYFTLNAVATRAWELMSRPSTFEDLFDAIQTEFDVEGARLDVDLRRVIVELQDLGLIKSVDGES